MAYIITGTENFDNKRTKVTLDYGEVTFLLYKAEYRSLKLNEGGELPEEKLGYIKEEILLPRAKKRMLYFMKNADKTEKQLRLKLKEGLYPQDVADKTIEFLRKYGFADDMRYAKSYACELKGSSSRREIEAKLMQRGVDRQCISESLSEISAEDEYAACERALLKKYPGGMAPEDKSKAYGFLARKGFSYDSIEHAVNNINNEN